MVGIKLGIKHFNFGNSKFNAVIKGFNILFMVGFSL
jgi:hypothetical protein